MTALVYLIAITLGHESIHLSFFILFETGFYPFIVCFVIHDSTFSIYMFDLIRVVGGRFDFDIKGACLCWTKMSLKSFVRELREMKDGIGSISKRGEEGSRHWRNRTMSHIAPDQEPSPLELIQQGRWANLPPELLLDIIRRVEESETSWPARAVVVSCASVCRSWRAITKEIIRTPEQCGRLTFPISLKQVLGFYPSSPLFG